MSLFIRISDELIDLYPNTVFALTINTLNFNNIGARSVDHSNAVKVPWTANNERIFGNISDENSDSDVPYTFLDCNVIQNGIEIVPYGKTLISKAEGNYTLQIYDISIDLFNHVKSLPISYLNAYSSTAWTAAGIDSSRNSANGIVSAVMSWGRSYIYNVNYFLPCFYYHNLVTKILESTGLTLSGGIINQQDFTRLAIPYPNDTFTYPTETYTGNADPNTLTFGSTEVTLFSFSPIRSSVNANIAGYITAESISFGSATEVRIDTYVNGVSIANEVVTNPLPFTPYVLSAVNNYDVNVGDVISLRIKSNGASANTQLVASLINITVIIGMATIDRNTVFWNRLLPSRVKCEAILKDFFTRFGVIYKQVENTLYLKTIEEIITDRSNVNDWTGKRVLGGQEIDFKNEYSTTNYLRYEQSEDVGSEQLGEGVISTKSADTNEKEIFRSPFANCRTIDVSGYYVATIPVYDSTSTGITDFKTKPGLRLVMLRDRADEAAITFNTTPRTDYKIAYFIDSLQDREASLQYYVDKYYKSFGGAIQKAKRLTKFYNLNDSDIKNYDPLKLVRDDEGFYLCNKILNYISGRVTKVELLKVG